MTSFLTGGLGSLNSHTRSPETAALENIDSSKLSYANKDFTKNIAWLNNSVDTLSMFSQKLQSGVDSANENILEQIQGFWGDLFLLFAGFEPTGIDVGDVKYVIQGLGAFFGINPDTPFPLNLLEGAAHFFTTYIIPLDQFTDVIFDAILAWAVDFGLSPEFVDSLKDLRDAITDLGASFSDLFGALGDLLGAFGFLGLGSTSGVGDLWDTLMDLIGGLAVPIIKPILQALAALGMPFIQTLTFIVRAGSGFNRALGAISGGQVAALSDNILPATVGSTLVWSVGGDSINGWIVDDTQSASDLSDGAFTTIGNGTAKRLLVQSILPCSPGQVFTVSGKLKWAGIPTLPTAFGVVVVWYNGATEQSTSNIDIASGHGGTGGWVEVISESITVPEDIDGFRVGCRVSSAINSGQVWVDDISARLHGMIQQSLISGLLDTLNTFLGPLSPVNVLNLFGQIPANLLGLIGIGNIGNTQPNLLVAPGFDGSDSISLGAGWTWDGTTGRTSPGCAKLTANGVLRQMVSNDIPVAEAQELAISAWLKWSGLSYTGTKPFGLYVTTYLAGNIVNSTEISTQTSPATNNSTWTSFSGNYTVPAGVDIIRVQFKGAATLTSGSVWFDDAIAKKTGLIQQGWVGGLQGALAALGGLIDDVGELLHGAIDAIISVIRGIPFVGGTLADLLDDLTGWHGDTQVAASTAVLALTNVTTLEPQVATVQTQVVNQQNYTITNQISGTRNKRWECRYPKGDVTFPEFYMTELSIFGITAGVTGAAVTAHTHDFDINTSTAEIGSWSILQNDSRAGYLGISQGIIADTVGIMARKRTNTAVDHVYLSIFKENPDLSTYQIFEQEISGDLAYPDMVYLEYDIPDLIVMQPGENYMVKVRNSSTVNTTVQIQGIWQDSRAVDSAWGTSGATDSVKTSYTAVENAANKLANLVLPWAMLAQKTEYPTDLSIADSFKRGTLGEVWKLQQSTAADHLDIVARGYIGYYGGGGGSVAGIRTQTISTDRMRVDGFLTGTGVAPPSGLIACCDEMMTNFVLLYVNSAGPKLYSTTNGSTYVQRSTLSKGANDGMWSVYYDPSINTFRVMQDEVLLPALDWLDSGNIITHGPNKRFAGARTDAVIFLFTQTKGPLISDFNVSDWSP